MEGERQARGAPAQEWGLGRAVSSRQLPLRENYIINRDREYKQLAGEVHKLIHTPKFNRFISLKKHALQNTPHLIDKLSPRPDIRKRLENGFNRR